MPLPPALAHYSPSRLVIQPHYPRVNDAIMAEDTITHGRPELSTAGWAGRLWVTEPPREEGQKASVKSGEKACKIARSDRIPTMTDIAVAEPEFKAFGADLHSCKTTTCACQKSRNSPPRVKNYSGFLKWANSSGSSIPNFLHKAETSLKSFSFSS